MQVEIVQQSLGLVVMPNQVLHAVNRWLPIVTHQIVTVQIVPTGIQTIQPFLNSIRIQHRYNDNLKVFPDKFGFFSLPC